ncbi:MAG: hypothetical protein ACI8TX_000209 [Hyphomicrobiaceae bacterium]
MADLVGDDPRLGLILEGGKPSVDDKRPEWHNRRHDPGGCQSFSHWNTLGGHHAVHGEKDKEDTVDGPDDLYRDGQPDEVLKRHRDTKQDQCGNCFDGSELSKTTEKFEIHVALYLRHSSEDTAVITKEHGVPDFIAAGVVTESDALVQAPLWQREPFRILFALGILLSWAGVFHWLFYALGILENYRPIFHAMTQIQGFMMCFAGSVLTGIF